MWSQLALPITGQSNIFPHVMDVIGSAHYLQYFRQNVYAESNHEEINLDCGALYETAGLNLQKYQCLESKHRQGTILD